MDPGPVDPGYVDLGPVDPGTVDQEWKNPEATSAQTHQSLLFPGLEFHQPLPASYIQGGPAGLGLVRSGGGGLLNHSD